MNRPDSFLPTQALGIFLLIGGLGRATVGFAQEDASAAALQGAHAELVKLFDATDDLFYKSQTDENGNTFYTIMWESEGESSRMVFGLRELGTYNQKPLFAVSAWTFVATSEKPMPPAVIKAVAVASDALLVGSYSCSQDFTKVYANMSGVLDGATPGSIWMYCAYLHSNRLKLKAQVDQAMAGS